jgi:TPR repeat protein
LVGVNPHESQNERIGAPTVNLSQAVLDARARDAKRLADQGNAIGQFNYGMCLHDGDGVRIDLRGAAHYFKLSADQGDAGGQCNYGLCLRNGIGVPIDFRGAAHYLKLSADQGDAGGQFAYGLCLLKGDGVPIDFRGAAHYLKLSADQGDAHGQFAYGICLRHGIGVPIDLRGAAHYFNLSAAQPGLVATSGVLMDLMRFASLDRKLAHSPDPTGIGVASVRSVSLSAVAESASGDSNDHRKSEIAPPPIQERAAVAQYSDVPPALYRIGCNCCGWCFREGQGVPIDFTVAAEFFQMAANSGAGRRQQHRCLP